MSLDLGVLVAKVQLDDGKFQQSVTGAKAKVAGLKKDLASIGTTKAKIDADSAAANAKIKQLKADLSRLDAKVKVDGATDEATAKIAAIKEQLTSVSDAKVTLGVDSAVATAKIKGVQLQLRELDDSDPTVDIKVNSGGGGKDGGLGAVAAGFGDAGAAMSKVMTIAGAVGPAVLAAGAAMSSAAAGATQLVGAVGPAAAGGLAVYAGGLLAVKSGLALTKFAMDGVADAAGGDKAAMAKLTPEGQRFAKVLGSLTPQLDRVRSALQGSMFDGFTTGTQRLAGAYLPLLTKAARENGDAIGDLADQGSKMASSGPWRKDFGTISASNASNLRLMGTASFSLADAARSLFVTAQPLIRTFLQWGAGAAGSIDAMVQAGRASGALSAFWDRAGKAGTTLGHIVGNVATALHNVFKIGNSGAGAGLLSTVQNITAGFKEWTRSSAGVEKISGWFASGRANLAAMGRLITAFHQGLEGIGSGKGLAPLIDQVTKQLIPPLTDFLKNASSAGALSSLVSGVSAVVKVFAALSANDASLLSFSKTLKVLADSALWVVKNVPGASTALGILFTVLGGSAALKLVGLGGALSGVAGAMSGLATKALVATGFIDAEAAATGRATIAAVASKVATLASAAASKAWAAGQWLLNAALTANPIGLVVVAVGALAVGFVALWKHSETFRGIVTGAFSAVLLGAAAVVQGFANLVSAGGHLPGKLGAPFRAVGGALDAAAQKTRGLAADISGLGAGTTSSTAAIRVHSTAIGQMAAQNKRAAMGAGEAASGLDREAAATRGATAATNGLRNASVKAMQGSIGLQQAIADARKQISSSAHTLDIHSQAGRDNRLALIGIATAAGQVTGSTKKQNGAIAEARQKIIEFAVQSGKTHAQAVVLADSLVRVSSTANKIPNGKKINITAPGLAGAIDGVGHLRTGLDGLPRRKNIDIFYKVHNPSMGKPRVTGNGGEGSTTPRATTSTPDPGDGGRLELTSRATTDAVVQQVARAAAGGKGKLGGVGKSIMAALTAGIHRGEEGLTSSLSRVSSLIERFYDKKIKNDKRAAAASKAAIKGLKDEYAAALKNARARDAKNAEIDAANQTGKDLAASANEYGSVTSIEGADIVGADGKATGEKAAVTAADIVAGERTRAAAIKTFGDQLAALRNQGLNETAIQDIAGKGVADGSAYATALASATAAQIAGINASSKQIGDASTAVGTNAVKGLVTGLTAQLSDIDAVGVRIADRLRDAIRKELALKVADAGKKSGMKVPAAKVVAAGTPRIGVQNTSGTGRTNLAQGSIPRAPAPTPARTYPPAPFIGSAVFRETVDVERLQREQAFRERMFNVGG